MAARQEPRSPSAYRRRTRYLHRCGRASGATSFAFAWRASSGKGWRARSSHTMSRPRPSQHSRCLTISSGIRAITGIGRRTRSHAFHAKKRSTYSMPGTAALTAPQERSLIQRTVSLRHELFAAFTPWPATILAARYAPYQPHGCQSDPSGLRCNLGRREQLAKPGDGKRLDAERHADLGALGKRSEEQRISLSSSPVEQDTSVEWYAARSSSIAAACRRP